jgi:transporter family-2 protein
MTFYLVLAALAGVGLAFQAVINARLGAALNSSIWAALVQVFVGLVLLFVCLALVRQPLPSLAGAARLPWWIWAGGMLGSAYVLTMIIITRPLGAALAAGAVIVGQMVAALVIDHYGWFGVESQRLSPLRVTGVILLLLGAVLIRWK